MTQAEAERNLEKAQQVQKQRFMQKKTALVTFLKGSGFHILFQYIFTVHRGNNSDASLFNCLIYSLQRTGLH